MSRGALNQHLRAPPVEDEGHPQVLGVVEHAQGGRQARSRGIPVTLEERSQIGPGVHDVGAVNQKVPLKVLAQGVPALVAGELEADRLE